MKQIFCGISIFTLLMSYALMSPLNHQVLAVNSYQNQVDQGVAYIKTQQSLDGGIIGFGGISDWSAMAFGATSQAISIISNGGESLLGFLLNHPPTDTSTATDVERAILAITANGYNPYDFGGVNYVKRLFEFHKNDQIGNEALLNDDIFGLLALVSANIDFSYDILNDGLQTILEHRQPDGGFSWSTSLGSDVDDTAAALQALIAAKSIGQSNLDEPIGSAKQYLLNAQNSDGGFPYEPADISNTSSTAWAVMAFSSLGYGSSKIEDALLFIANSQQLDGSFEWMNGFGGDTFSTTFSILALNGSFWPIKQYDGVPSGLNAARLEITKKLTSMPTVEVGDMAAFDIKIKNIGELPISSFSLIDEYDENYLEYQSASVDPSEIVDGKLTWVSLKQLAPGELRTFKVNFIAKKIIEPPGTQNRVLVSGAYDSKGKLVKDAQDFANVNISSAQESDLNIVIDKKLMSENPARIGDEVIFLVAIKNNSKSNVSSFNFLDNFDKDRLTFEYALVDGKKIKASKLESGLRLWKDVPGSNLAPEETLRIELHYIAKGLGTAHNSASVYSFKLGQDRLDNVFTDSDDVLILKQGEVLGSAAIQLPNTGVSSQIISVALFLIIVGLRVRRFTH